MSWQTVKVIPDFIMCSAALIICLPILLVVAVAVKLDSAGPILFTQERMGLGSKPYRMFKFRTMYVNSQDGFGPHGRALTRTDDRITKVGKFLRASSIDEIPQLWNVVRGEMALIGPRPILPVQVEQLTSYQKERFRVKPGLTGLVVVCGGYSLSWRQRLRLDVWYVRHQSFGLDCYIFFKTIALLLFGRSIYNAQGISEDLKPIK